ncbi:molecular chaperone DnaJ [Buchnera aphidicola (Taiwanaphis decaspermi)]|uniref:molecular chaperone DnaJ n=1 Tax=Buchnera aphidicola TaxID=9 RepID=UPI0031B89861
MVKKDYYQTLNISNTAQDQEIKKAYKRLAIKYHPDRNQGNKNAEKKFKKIKEAYEILIDPKKRSAYDQYGHAAFQQGNTGEHDFSSNFTSTTADFGDIFGDVFGDIFGDNSSNRKGVDLKYEMELNLEEAVKGVTKKINIPTLNDCNICNGTGSKFGQKISKCFACNGNGQINMRKGFFTVQQTCPSCYGKGKVIKNPCYKCNGKGKIKTTKNIAVKIPAGIDTNDNIKLPNQGESSPDDISIKGDLYVQIKIKKHKIFKRNNNDLYCKVPLNFAMAALGGEIEVPTLDGKVKLKIPPETQTNKIFRIRSKGVKSIRNHICGDLFCKVIVETPVNLNKHQKKLIYELGNSFINFKNNINSPKSKRFFDGVKRFFDDLTK